MSNIRVLLVDDHEIVRLGLMTLIDDRAGMEVVGEAGTTVEALQETERLKPDVILMDIRIPGDGGIEATREIVKHYPRAKVVILTSYADEELLVRAIRAGAVGYVLKEVGNRPLLNAIEAAARGEALLDPGSTARLLVRLRERERQADENAFGALSERELQVLAEVPYGRTNAEIGHHLGLSEKTVRNYVSTILEKLGLTNRIELATFSVKHHLSDLLDSRKEKS